MKKLFLILVGIISVTSLKAQSDNSESAVTTKSVYGELLGSGLAISANFDSRFSGTKGLGYRIGLGFVPLKGTSAITIPFGLNAIFGKRSSFFEAEFTATVLTTSSGKFNGKSVSSVFLYPHIGYRYTKPAKSFFGRIYAGPMFYGSELVPYAGISLGYTL